MVLVRLRHISESALFSNLTIVKVLSLRSLMHPFLSTIYSTRALAAERVVRRCDLTENQTKIIGRASDLSLAHKISRQDLVRCYDILRAVSLTLIGVS